MNILFVFRSIRPFHYHQTTLEALCARGHRVCALFDYEWSKSKTGVLEIVEAFKQRVPGFTYGWAVNIRQRGSTKGPYTASASYGQRLLFSTREILSYRNYLFMPAQSLFYKERWRKYMPRWIRFLSKKTGLIDAALETRSAGKLLRFFEKIILPSAAISADLKKYMPSVVVVSPGNMRHSSAELEYLKAARALGIPTALQVLSWDNLTTKGTFHVMPDRVLCWNEVQQSEAEIFHNVPKEKIRLTGAPVFDGWFTKLNPSITREEFCGQYGLAAGDPILLYLGSSVNIAPDERWLIQEFRRMLDGADDPRIRKIQLVVRPHPGNFHVYQNFDSEKIRVIPKGSTLKILPTTHDALQLFYDTLHYAIATIGINTSGMIDAIIADCPGMAYLADRYKTTQEEAQHFQQLVAEDALVLVKTPQEFIEYMHRLLEGEDTHKARRRAFVEKFIRPRGLDRPAGEVAADEIEKLL